MREVANKGVLYEVDRPKFAIGESPPRPRHEDLSKQEIYSSYIHWTQGQALVILSPRLIFSQIAHRGVQAIIRELRPLSITISQPTKSVTRSIKE